MAKQVDVSFRNVFYAGYPGGVFLTASGWGLNFMFFESANALAYQIGNCFWVFSALLHLLLLPYFLCNLKVNRLLNYNLLAILAGFSLLGLIVFQLGFLGMVFLFQSELWSVSAALTILAYYSFLFRRIQGQIRNDIEFAWGEKNAFVERDGTMFFRVEAMHRMAESINQEPISLSKLKAAGVLFVLLVVALVWLGVPYNPDSLIVQGVLAALAVPLTMAFMAMALVHYQMNYVLPKRVFGAQWKNVQREVV